MKIDHRFFTTSILVFLGAASLHAATFVVSSTNDNTARTLNDGETGTVNNGASISRGSNVGVTMSGTSQLTNNGTIQTTSGRAIDATAANEIYTVTNNGTITVTSTDAFRVNANSEVSLLNKGTIQVTNGGQAIDWAGITNKSNTLTNEATGIITAFDEDAVRPGNGGTIINAGTISATLTSAADPAGGDGIDLRTQKTNVSVTNTGTISGRHGIATDGANVGPSSLTVNNNAGGVITALNGSGINLDGVSVNVTANVTNAQGATIKGGVMAAATEADGDGLDVDGVLTLNNSGDILGLGAKGASNPEGIAAGGGSITNTATGRIIGSGQAADAPNGDTTKAGNGILIDNSNGGNAVAATTVTNSGLIQGKGGFGVKIIGTFADTVTNNAGGTIRGSGAIMTGDGADTVTNRGSIIGDNGQAIDLEAGNDSLIIEGASASITGNVSGGTGTNTATINPGAGNTFSYAGSLSNFSSVDISSGNVILSGASTYSGNTTVSGTLSVTNTTGSATGTGSVIVNSGGTLNGTGHVGNVSIASGGILSPGLSPGTLNIDGTLDLVSGSQLAFELGSLSDLLNISGTLSFTGGGMAIFNIADAGGLTSGGDYTLMNYGSVSGLSLANLSFGSTPAGFSGAFTIGANSLTLHVDAAPEPSRALLGILGFAFISLRRRRKTRATV